MPIGELSGSWFQGAQSKPVGEPIFHPQELPRFFFLVWFLITREGGEDYHPNSWPAHHLFSIFHL